MSQRRHRCRAIEYYSAAIDIVPSKTRRRCCHAECRSVATDAVLSNITVPPSISSQAKLADEAVTLNVTASPPMLCHRYCPSRISRSGQPISRSAHRISRSAHPISRSAHRIRRVVHSATSWYIARPDGTLRDPGVQLVHSATNAFLTPLEQWRKISSHVRVFTPIGI